METSDRPYKATGCATARTFYRLRRDLLQLLPVTRRELRPSTRLDAIIPRDRLQSDWGQLQTLWRELPNLEISRSLTRWMELVVVAATVSVSLALKFWPALLMLIPIGWIAWATARPFAIKPPMNCETLREAAIYLTHFSAQDHAAGLWPRAEVAARTRMIIARQLGMPFSQVKEESRFVDDLGLD